MMLNNNRAVPFGIVTLSLVAVTAAYSWWAIDDCKTIEQDLQQGYFLRWMPPQLLLLTANKESYIVEAESKKTACTMMLKKLSTPNR